MHPATLAAGLGPHFLNRLPEAERAVGDCELGADGKPTPFEVEEQLLPGLCTFAYAVDQADELLLALRRFFACLTCWNTRRGGNGDRPS